MIVTITTRVRITMFTFKIRFTRTTQKAATIYMCKRAKDVEYSEH